MYAGIAKQPEEKGIFVFYNMGAEEPEANMGLPTEPIAGPSVQVEDRRIVGQLLPENQPYDDEDFEEEEEEESFQEMWEKGGGDASALNDEVGSPMNSPRSTSIVSIKSLKDAKDAATASLEPAPKEAKVRLFGSKGVHDSNDTVSCFLSLERVLNP